MQPLKHRLAVALGMGVLMVSLGLSQGSGKFRSDDPLQVDPDQLPIPPPEPVRLSQIFDFLKSTYSNRPDDKTPIPPAENVNTLGEVPDSSWFTNRMTQPGGRSGSVQTLGDHRC